MNTGQINEKHYKQVFDICKEIQKDLLEKEKYTIDFLTLKKKIQKEYPEIKEETIQRALDDMELKGYIISTI
jgi:DNA-binding PadR family transcriptional regulator